MLEGNCKVEEEYWWAMTQAAETVNLRPTRLQCFGSLNFKLDSFEYANIVDHIHTQFRLAPELPPCNYCITRGDSLHFLF